MLWIVTANTNMCRIYGYETKPATISLCKEISHPENRLKKSDYFTSDKPGHYKAGTATRGSYEQDTDPKEVAIDNFAREIAHELNKGRNSQEFSHLIIITPPHMSGLLSKHIDKNTHKLILNEIHKDVIALKQNELLQYLQKNLLLSSS